MSVRRARAIRRAPSAFPRRFRIFRSNGILRSLLSAPPAAPLSTEIINRRKARRARPVLAQFQRGRSPPSLDGGAGEGGRPSNEADPKLINATVAPVRYLGSPGNGPLRARLSELLVCRPSGPSPVDRVRRVPDRRAAFPRPRRRASLANVELPDRFAGRLRREREAEFAPRQRQRELAALLIYGNTIIGARYRGARCRGICAVIFRR